MATHSSILAWEIPHTEEPGGLKSMGPQLPKAELELVGTFESFPVIPMCREGVGQPILGRHLHHTAHGHFPLLKFVRTWQDNEPDSGKKK